MKKYSVKVNGGKFFLGFSKSGNGTIWATMEQGTGCVPTFWDLYRALSKVQEQEDVFHASREGEVWSPTAGWVQENLVAYEEEAPGASSPDGDVRFEDYTLTKLVPRFNSGQRGSSSRYTSRWRGAQSGASCPGAFLEYCSELPPPPQTGGLRYGNSLRRTAGSGDPGAV